MKKNLLLMLTGFLLFTLSSCLVSKKKFDEQVALADKYKAEKENCNERLSAANATIDDLNKQIANLAAEIQKWKDLN